MRSKFIGDDAAAALIRDGDTVALTGGGGGQMEATCLFQAIERRFLATPQPRDLSVVHALGIGDKKTLGMNCFAHGGGSLDIAFLGFGEFDAEGNVNVSRLGGLAAGPGGFIDIAQNARKVVFCGTFAAKGVQLATGAGRLDALRAGAVRKLVGRVEQVTFSGPQAVRRGQDVLYPTERAGFRLTEGGVELFEIAPGVDLQRDVLAAMAFAPRLAAQIALMPAAHFTAADDRSGALAARDKA